MTEKLPPEPQVLGLTESEIIYYPYFLEHALANELFRSLLDNTPWREDQIKLFGKVHLQPRLTALYGDNGLPYSYSGILMHPHPFTQELLDLKARVDSLCGLPFTSCLLNLYRDGKDSNGWHSDNEKELGANPVIASVSLGQARTFRLKHRTIKGLRHSMVLEHGSLLLMRGETQHFWLHQVPKTKRLVTERINITFRVIK